MLNEMIAVINKMLSSFNSANQMSLSRCKFTRELPEFLKNADKPCSGYNLNK